MSEDFNVTGALVSEDLHYVLSREKCVKMLEKLESSFRILWCLVAHLKLKFVLAKSFFVNLKYCNVVLKPVSKLVKKNAETVEKTVDSSPW